MKMMEGNRAVLIAILIMVAFNAIFLSLNGLFMLIAPLVWYDFVPGVTDTGFFNQHFIRDIGIPRRGFRHRYDPAGAPHWAVGRRDVVAHRACRFPPVGSCRRHLLSISNSPRFSCCHPAGDHRGGAYPLGHQSLARRASRIRLRAAEQTFKLKLRGRVWISSPNLFTLSSMTYIFSNTFWRPMFAVPNFSRPATASL